MPEVREDIAGSLELVLHHAARAEALGADLVSFPECCLQGYVLDYERAHHLAIDLSSQEFDLLLERLSKVRPTLVIGLIEVEGEKLHNSAVVVKQGKLTGKYRKTKLRSAERIFEQGTEYPIFTVDDLRFGINICNDLNFPECAKAISRQNAHLLVCPCNNMMPRADAENWKHRHNETRARRAIETGLWVLSSAI